MRSWTPNELQRILSESDKLSGWLDNRIRRSAFVRAMLLTMDDTQLTYSALTSIRGYRRAAS